jgi:adenylylsulfate kinase
VTSFISPFRADQNNVRKIVGVDFHEFYRQCSLEVCEDRDIKGLYEPAQAGEIPGFTGISSPFKQPEFTGLMVYTESHLDECSR